MTMEARIRYSVQIISLALVLLLYLVIVMLEKKVKLSPPLPLKESFAKSSVVKTLIVTSWRSGSTLLGELLNSHPGM